MSTWRETRRKTSYRLRLLLSSVLSRVYPPRCLFLPLDDPCAVRTGQDDDDETLYVDADDVLRVLEDFMDEKHNLDAADLLPDKKKKKRQQNQVGERAKAKE